MPAKRVEAAGRQPQRDGYARATYRFLTATENQSMIRSIAVFGVNVLLFSPFIVLKSSTICLFSK